LSVSVSMLEHMFDERVPTGPSLIRSMDDGVAAMASASAEVLQAVASFDERRLWKNDGATSMTPWLAARYGLTWGTAREWMRVAGALRSLPTIARRYRQGLLSWDQLRPLTRFATPATDRELADEASTQPASELWREARRHERIRTEEAQDLHATRSFWMWWDQELPVLYLEGRLPADQGAALEEALNRRAEQIVLAEPVAGRPQEARLADALVELATGSGRDEAPPATLVVHADAAALTREEPGHGPWLAETASGTRLCTEAVRRLACDAKIEWVLESGGRSVGIGRRGRIVPGAIGRLLRHRDRHCRFPGCERTMWLNAHHLSHWARGGTTDLGNLILLCHSHHRLLHEGGWTTGGSAAGGLRFHDPTGRPLRAAAESRRDVDAGGVRPPDRRATA